MDRRRAMLVFYALVKSRAAFILFIYSRYTEPDWQQKLKYIGDIHNTITDRNLYKQKKNYEQFIKK